MFSLSYLDIGSQDLLFDIHIVRWSNSVFNFTFSNSSDGGITTLTLDSGIGVRLPPGRSRKAKNSIMTN